MSERERRDVNGALGDIAIEKFNASRQDRGQPRRFPGIGPDVGRPVADPTECQPPQVPPDFPKDARRYFEFAQLMVQKTLRTSMEDAVGKVMQRTLEKLPFSVTAPWVVPPVDSEPFDIMVPANAPVVLPPAALTPTTVLTFGPVNSRMIAVVNFVGQALESSAAFADVEWTLLVEGRQVPGIPSFVGQLSELVRWSPLARTVPLRGGQSFSVVARNFGAAAHTAVVRIGGWQWMSTFLSATLTENLQGTATRMTNAPMTSVYIPPPGGGA